MFLPIDPSSGLPIYRQIIDQIRRMVAAGKLRSGDRLPSVRSLAATLQISYLTVAKAYGELERQGLLEARRGLGMFVAPPAATEGGDSRQQETVVATAQRLVVEALQCGMSLPQTVRLLERQWQSTAVGGGEESEDE